MNGRAHHSRRLRGLRGAWIGPAERELGWLRERMESLGVSLGLTVAGNDLPASEVPASEVPASEVPASEVPASERRGLDRAIKLLDEVCQAGVQRLVLACPQRWDFPAVQLEHLRTRWPEVPVAVATGDWWDGAGRTGVGPAMHLMLPWHRWWDGWLPWLQASSSHWFGAAPTSAAYLRGSPDDGRARLSAPAVSGERACVVAGCVVSGCGELAEGWRLAACPMANRWTGSKEPAGADVDQPLIRTLQPFQLRQSSMALSEESDVAWCLLDDSSLDTIPSKNRTTQWGELIDAARQRFPQARLICAMHQPDWRLWRSLAAGANRPRGEILSKPATGAGLRRILEELDAELANVDH